MRTPRQPLFLARDSYRRRRVMDAARLLPFIGIFLFALPIFWVPEARTDSGPGDATAREGLYLFIVWLGLILATALLSRWLTAGLDDAGDGAEAEAPPRLPARPEG